MPWFPRGGKFHDWPADATDLPADQVIELYNRGFMGARYDPDAMGRFRDAMPEPDGDLVCHKYGLADGGKDKLVIPFVHALEMFPGCWPGPGQGRGDCVSWSTRNAALLTLVCDIVSGLPDENTGKPEEKPDVPEAGIKDGVLSTEAIYWYRGYDGDGWQCPDAAIIACKKGGVVLRQNYQTLGFDLTRYNAKMAGKYGRQAPPSNVEDMTNDHLIHQATDLNSFEAARDMLWSGRGVSTCGGEGLSDTRDEWGVSRRQGNWSHAMAYIGADDRPEIKQKYSEPLVLDLNSHGKFNKGSRDIYDSAKMVPPAKRQLWIDRGIVNSQTGNIMIPEGSCWIRYSEMRNREMIAFAGVKGWEAREIKLDYSPF